MTTNRHEAWEELVSASLTGDLTADERTRLDAHLDGCAHCRSAMAAFADGRRIVSGLRHVAPPRDLGARVRAGIEYESVPWWRRPALLFTAVGGSLAAVAGALLALVLLNAPADDPEVGRVSPTPEASTPAASATATADAVEPTSAPTLPTPETPAPGETPGPAPTPGPDATPNPIAEASPEPDLYVAMTGPADDQALTVVEPASEEPVAEPEPSETVGPPIAAELSPDGGWVAVITEVGASGMNELTATRVAEATPPTDPAATPIPEPSTAVGDSVDLGQTLAGGPFLERLAWAPDGSLLAYTLADPDTGDTDVWLFEPETARQWQLTDVGDAYAARWATLGEGTPEESMALWVSRAENVTSYLVTTADGSGARPELIDPASDPVVVAEHVFQPIVSPNGALAIYWDGVMAESDVGWQFAEAGAPYLAEHRPDGEGGPFPNERALFSDVTIDRDAFSSAAVAWSLNSDTYAVWATAWTGLPQSSEGTYPDPTRVYFGRASDPRGLTRGHAIDRGDLPPDWNVIDVKVSPAGEHLVVTVAAPRGGVLEAPTARLLLIKRNTGTVADVVTQLGAEEGRWFGPAVFDAFVEIEGEEVEAP